MAKTTSLISYNCQSAKASLGIINNLLQKCDILLLQETFLPTIDNTLENLFTNFNVIKIAAVRKEDQTVGRASGGLAILCRRNTFDTVEPFYGNERICGIFITVNNKKYLILNLYLN